MASGGRTHTVLIEVDGLQVKVTKRTGQKRAYLRVKPGDGLVYVSCPWRMSQAQVVGFVRQNRTWVDARRAMAQEQPGSVSNPPTQEELRQWTEMVMQATPGLVAHWAAVLGVSPGRIVYRNMVSRWGSCNVRTGRICINVQLGAFDPQCLEYVVVHELCHLIVPGHGREFYQLLDAQLPNWKVSRDMLKGRGVRR